MTDCNVQEVTLARGTRAVRIENALLEATVLVDKGADIYQLIYKPKQIDVLWKSPWGLPRPGGGMPSTFDSLAAWMQGYEGGWQMLFPNGGTAGNYKGAALNFHGEASAIAWDIDNMKNGEGFSELLISTRLTMTPFRIERTMRVEAGKPDLIIMERITNEGREEMEYMWGHHPAYGPPFLSEHCLIDTNATKMTADPRQSPPNNPLSPGETIAWPPAPGTPDLAMIPGEDIERGMMAYFTVFDGDTGWYGLTNRALGMGVGLVWSTADYPYAWHWQELHASAGYPWYKAEYVMAIEPNTSYPGGLLEVAATTKTQRTLGPGESAAAELRAVFYESAHGISGISRDGTVTMK